MSSSDMLDAVREARKQRDNDGAHLVGLGSSDTVVSHL